MPYVSTRLGRWFYEEHGMRRHPHDASIVLLHGLMLDRRMWTTQISRLRNQGRVLAFDGPGHGLSDVPPPFDLTLQAQALEDALKQARAERAVLVGQGWGALVALRLALRQNISVAGLVLSGMSVEPESALARLRYRLCKTHLRWWGAPHWFVRRALAPYFYGPRARRLRPALASNMHQAIGDHPREGVLRALDAVFERSAITEPLSDLKMPVLIASGQDDPTTLPCHSEALARSLPSARLVWMACGHTPPQERPEDFAMAVVPFVRRVLSIRPVSSTERATG